MAMSALALTLFAALTVGLAAGDQIRIAPGRCSGAPDIDFTESINAYLRRIPNNITMPLDPEKNWVVGFKFSAPAVTGLGSLLTYKPYHIFCVGNNTMMEVVAFGNDPLTLSVNWKSCTGHRGKFGTKVKSSKLRLYFASEPTPADPTKIVAYKIDSDILDEPGLFIEGVRGGPRVLVDVLSFVTMPHLEHFWRRFLGIDVMSLLTRQVEI